MFFTYNGYTIAKISYIYLLKNNNEKEAIYLDKFLLCKQIVI
jgi:hypothetical protein